MIHATKKSMQELGDKLHADEKSRIEKAIEELQEAVKGDDKALIETRTNSLAEASGKMAERLYAEKAAAGEAEAAGGAKEGDEAAAEKDAVVDAEFEEVKENKK